MRLERPTVDLALEGKSAIMPTIVRLSDDPYQWGIGSVALSEVANREKLMPVEYISENGFCITDACRQYLAPLIQGRGLSALQCWLAPICQA